MGSGLTEREVLDCLSENFRLAAQNAERLAVTPKRGLIYREFRAQIQTIETASRQIAYMRGGDARWLQIGIYMADCHKRAGDWLRGIKQPNGSRRPVPEGTKHPLFMKLAENLRAAHRRAEDFRTKATGRTGPILPVVRPLDHQRESPPVGWRKTQTGLVIPTAA